MERYIVRCCGNCGNHVYSDPQIWCDGCSSSTKKVANTKPTEIKLTDPAKKINHPEIPDQFEIILKIARTHSATKK